MRLTAQELDVVIETLEHVLYNTYERDELEEPEVVESLKPYRSALEKLTLWKLAALGAR